MLKNFERTPFSLVLAPPFNPTIRWSDVAAEHAVIPLCNLSLLTAAADTALQQGVEIARIVFDQTITAEEYLSFLASVSAQHRSDVVMIQPSGDGFISAVTRHEGRVIYRVLPADLAFYMEMHYPREAARMAS